MKDFFSGSYFSPKELTPAQKVAQRAAEPKINALAVIALISTATGFLWVIGFLAGAVCGFIALRQIRRAKPRQLGRGLALAATIISMIALSLMALAWAMYGVSLMYTNSHVS